MKQVCPSIDALWKVFAKVSEKLPNTGGVFEKPQMVSIDDYKPPRTLAQNARFHCMVRALAKHTGHSERELKTWFKEEYGVKKRIQVGNQGRIIAISTIDYNRKQLAELMEQVDRVCAECGVYVETEA